MNEVQLRTYAVIATPIVILAVWAMVYPWG